MLKKIYTSIILISSLVSILSAAVESQWRGPERDGKYPETNLLKTWPASGPSEVWSFSGLGKGYSSPAVTADHIYLTGSIDGTGTLFALDAGGKLLWKKAYGPDWDKSYPGVRTTPTIVDNYIYIISGLGTIYCLKTSNGDLVWSVDSKVFNGKNIRWGIAESPLIDGNKVFFTPGGPDAAIVALDRLTGKVLWKSKGANEESSYCSPVIVKHGNAKLYFTMTKQNIVCLNAETGQVYWTAPHKTDWDINPNTPYYKNGMVFFTSGYGTGSDMYKLSADGKSATLVWHNKSLDSQKDGFIELDGYIYGCGHKKSEWQCLDWNTGTVKWTSKALSQGNIIFAEGLLYCYSDKGEVALVKPDPTKFNIISQFKVTKGTHEHWAHPVIKNGFLFIRHGDTLVAYNISK